jgi:hypothetical protein
MTSRPIPIRSAAKPPADIDPDLMTKVKVNNSLRGVISSAMSQLTLLSRILLG